MDELELYTKMHREIYPELYDNLEFQRDMEELQAYMHEVYDLRDEDFSYDSELLQYITTANFWKASCCNIISAMVCYMNGEFTREMLIEDIKRSTRNDKDIIEHLETIL